MSIDFSLILVVVTAFSGVIWAIDAMFFRSRRLEPVDGQQRQEPVIVEYARSFFPVLLVVLVVRSFLFEPFRIPSSSMVPTLRVGDFIFVNKFTYGLRLPVTNSKIFKMGDPERGDVIVFKLPADPGTNYIKRLVGLPGDIVRYQNRRLSINGELMDVQAMGTFQDEDYGEALLFEENLEGVEHEILLMPGQRSLEGTFRVPKGHYFMMGDNRDNSKDSRYRGVGIIPDDKIVGKAVRVWMNWDFPGMPEWGRIGMAID